MKRKILTVVAMLCLFVLLPATALAAGEMSPLEQQIVEMGFRLLPYDHPFVLAYQEAHKVKIKSYRGVVGGVEVSGVPFEFGGSHQGSGFKETWWNPSGVYTYPVEGMDCASYIHWIYSQLGYEVPNTSSSMFLGGKAGVERTLPGVRTHLVIPSFEEAMIGDIAYNSESYGYKSGHGSHVQLYLGTARKLGIEETILKYYREFPVDAHLVLDCGWSDGAYYYLMMKSLGIDHARNSMAGVGVQFFTSIKSGSEYIYKSPTKVYKWTHDKTVHTFRVESRLEVGNRLLQHNPKDKIEYPMNLSRPIYRTDAQTDQAESTDMVATTEAAAPDDQEEPDFESETLPEGDELA